MQQNPLHFHEILIAFSTGLDSEFAKILSGKKIIFTAVFII